MFAFAYESSGQPLPQVSEVKGHSRSSPVLCDAPRLLMAYCVVILSTRAEIVMLTTYVVNLIPKLVVDTTSLMPWFYLSTGWRSSSPRMQREPGYTPLEWLYCKAWMATKLARS